MLRVKYFFFKKKSWKYAVIVTFYVNLITSWLYMIEKKKKEDN